MSRISVPINMETVTEENIRLYLDAVKKCGAERVFLIGLDFVYQESSMIYRDPDKIRFCIREFRKVCKEVGFWFSTMGHGDVLSFQGVGINQRLYTPLEGIRGEISNHGYCLSDENFRNDLARAIQRLASFGPDIIMLDDDYRMNNRPCHMACFCPTHLDEYYKRIGEEIPRDRLEELILQGGKNKYRTEYMRLMRDTLIGSAEFLRKKLDEVNPAIRLGASVTQEAWDASGFEASELALAFAGNTEPFIRVAGAPYWNTNVIHVTDLARLELKWLRNNPIETMTEGDTYPRPRYNVPSKALELFDLLLLADGGSDGILNYVFDYSQKPEYETGYVDRFVRNQPLRQDVMKLFNGKRCVGVKVFQHNRLIENWDLPTRKINGIFERIYNNNTATWSELLSKNSIPVAFEGDYPLFVVGENAKYISTDGLKNGAILDAQAAEILKNRGIDTGLIKSGRIETFGEYFIREKDTINKITGVGTRALYCKENAEILSIFTSGNQPASYYYENDDGIKFLVLGFDHYASDLVSNYFCNYYRQAQLVEFIEKLGGRKLPAKSFKNPNLYIIAAKNDKSMSVALANIFPDDIFSPEIILDREYSQIKFINCTGTLDGNKVILSDMNPYAFAMFEVE